VSAYVKRVRVAKEPPPPTVDTSQTVPCDVCEGRKTVRTTTDDAWPCSRCRGTGRRLAVSDPMAAPHVQEVIVPAFGGSVRLRSASGGLEALWISLRDEGGRAVIFDEATRAWLPASLRLTPNDARALAALLNRYADTHAETSDD